MAILDGRGMSRALGDFRYARRGQALSGGRRLLFWGDSITEGALAGGASPPAAGERQSHGASYATLAALLAGDGARLVHNAGVAGERTDAILARFDRDVAPYRPDVVVVLAGTNDIDNTVGLTEAQSQASLREMARRVLDLGALPILATLLPRHSTAAGFERLLRTNAFLRALAESLRVPLLDAFPLLADPQTGRGVARYTLTVAGSSGGTYTLRVQTNVVNGVREANPATGGAVNGVTGALAFDATAAQVAAALNAVPNVGAGTFGVTGAAGGPYTIRCSVGYPFAILLEASLLTGTNPTVTPSLDESTLSDAVHPNRAGQRLMAEALRALLERWSTPSVGLLAEVNDNGGQGVFPLTDATNLVRNGLFQFDSNADGWPDFWTINTSAFALATPAAPVGNWLEGTTTGSAAAYLGHQELVASRWSPGDTLAFVGRVQAENVESTGARWTVQLEAGGQGWAAARDVPYDLADGWFHVEMTVPAGATSVAAAVLVAGAAGATVRVSQLAVRNLSAVGF